MYSALLLKPKERVDALNVLAVPLFRNEILELLFLGGDGPLRYKTRQGSWEQ